MKIVIMVGLPASGKTTRARELLAEGNTVRVNKDSLREMLHMGKWSGRNEGITQDISLAMVEFLLTKGHCVIVDDTNLNPRVVQGYKDLAMRLGAKIQYERMETPVEECIARDREREKPVGRGNIVSMALKAGIYPKPAKGFVLCDLDGTLADVTHRLHFVRKDPKDWEGFFANAGDDGFRREVWEQVEALRQDGHELFLVSARPDKYRQQTAEWMARVCPAFKASGLIMRRAGDRRPDTEVKADMLKLFTDHGYPIHKVFDDRPRVIEMWRSHGLDVVDVGSGVDF